MKSRTQSNDLRSYLCEQILDYTKSETRGGEVSPAKLKLLENGVSNICSAAYPEEMHIIAKNVPRIVRTALDVSQ